MLLNLTSLHSIEPIISRVAKAALCEPAEPIAILLSLNEKRLFALAAEKVDRQLAQRPVRSAAGGFMATFGFGLRLAESSS